MSILDDLFDCEVFQFHVSVLGRNPAFLGVTGRSIVVAVHWNWLVDHVAEPGLHSFLDAHIVHFFDKLVLTRLPLPLLPT